MPTDPEILARAKKDFKRCEEWEAPARANFIADMKFGNGDAYNRWQWPDALAAYRELKVLPDVPKPKLLSL